MTLRCVASGLLFAMVVVVVTVSRSSVRADDLDCSTRPAAYDNPGWSCVKASSYAGRCVPASDFGAWTCLELDADATFCNDGVPFHTTVYLSTDGVNLDCSGQTIEHAQGERASGRPGVRAPYANSIRDVAIRRCNIRSTGSYGIDLRRFFRGAELDGPMTGHEHVSIQDVTITHTARIGIYVGQNSKRVVIDHVPSTTPTWASTSATRRRTRASRTSRSETRTVAKPSRWTRPSTT